MIWVISIAEPDDGYEALSEDAAIEAQNRAFEISEEAAEDLQATLREELGFRFKVRVDV